MTAPLPMTPRQRVLAALNHETPDRCPMQINFTPEFAQRVCEHMGLGTGRGHNPHGSGNTYVLERVLGVDLLVTSIGWSNCYYQQKDPYTDEWGVGWRPCEYQTKFGVGYYTEVVANPLADDKAIETYRPPDPTRPEIYADARRLVEEHAEQYYIVGAATTTIFETAWALRGGVRLMMDFVVNPELANRILDIPYHFHGTAAKRLVEMGVDMIWLGDDVGTQRAMMISPDHWRKFLKPRMSQLIAELKAINPAVKVAYHSDGSISTIIPELIEVGIDVLHPIQPACLDPAEVKRKYGDRLCFWGSVDEQYTLPFGTPDDVRREVRERLETVGYNGGLILGPTHHVQLDTPMENFQAMVETITGVPLARKT